MSQPVKTTLVDFGGKGKSLKFEDGYDLNLDNLLYRETLSPIPQGDAKTGLLFFSIEGVALEEQLDKPGTVFNLQAQDVRGRVLKAFSVTHGGPYSASPHMPAFDEKTPPSGATRDGRSPEDADTLSKTLKGKCKSMMYIEGTILSNGGIGILNGPGACTYTNGVILDNNGVNIANNVDKAIVQQALDRWEAERKQGNK
jgi:hypothetical protein